MDLKKIVFLLLLSPTWSRAVEMNPLAAQQQNDEKLLQRLTQQPAPQIFVVQEPLDVKAPHDPKEIIYGNEEIGFFASKNFTRHQNRVVLKFIPPTYRKPIKFFYIERADANEKQWKFLAERSYRNPIGNLQNLTKVDGRFSFPFTMLSGTTRSIPVALNRLGEIVWMLSPQNPNRNLDPYGIEILDQGEFMFLGMNQSTELLWMDSFGKFKYNINFAKKNIPFPSTHTVQYLPKTNEILFISPDCRQLPLWQEFVPLFSGPMGWLRRLYLPRRGYAGSKIVRMNLDNYNVTEVWNSYNDFRPDRNPSLALGYMTAMDRFMDIWDVDQYKRLLVERNTQNWIGWPDKFCDVDWTHENSAHFFENKGYLVSIRNLNQIVFLDTNGKLLWSMGIGPGHTYNLRRDGPTFSMQHSPILRDDGKILLYDNNTPSRGFLGTPFGNRLMLIDTKKPGDVRPEWIFPILAAHSDVRGSTLPLPDNRAFGYYAGNPGNFSEIFEVDISSSTKTASLYYQMFQGNKSFEAKPFWSFGGDRFIDTKTSSKAIPPPPADFLEFSY